MRFKHKHHRRHGHSPPIQKKTVLISAVISLLIAIGVFFASKNPVTGIISFFALLVLFVFYSVANKKLKEYATIKKMEAVFPDFLQLMSSNLRAGMTTDKAILLSARKEFDPLDKQIMKLGKELFTGKKIEKSLLDMAERIRSDKITKTISLIVSGVRAGGNISVLLEQTATSMRERNFVEKRSASSVLMYVIFIFFAIAVGAPALFAMSSVLVAVLSNILSNIPAVDTSSVNLPFTLTQISITPEFITYFSIVFIVVIDILGAFVIGLVNKGEEKEGVKLIIPLLAISLTIFFSIRIILSNYFAGFFS